MTQQKGIKMGYLAAILYSLFIGLSFMFVKLIVPIAAPLDILAIRFMLAFIFLTIPVLFGWVKLNVKLKDFYRFVPFALLYPVLFFTLQTWGLLEATSAEGGIIQATAPIFTIILATLFLKEKTNIWQKLSLLLSVSGVIFIFAMQGSSFSLGHMKGILLLLASTLSFAVYTIFVRRLGSTFKPYDMSYMVIMLSFISFSGASITQHVTAGTISTLIATINQPVFWYSILYLSLFSTVFAIILSNFALAKLEAYKVSVFMNLSTLVSIVAGAIFLGELLTYVHIVGAIMIIVGVLGTNLAGRWGNKSSGKTNHITKNTNVAS
ncbi:DMT family transporter [Shimazuella kribbensis]|uniref:DMT family transporter n=1 Tax=Shimazuella kribbensis TaxID=139808 RepID=UPI0003F8A399|nr:DMT family transporter [Shimazuella kribbensis]